MFSRLYLSLLVFLGLLPTVINAAIVCGGTDGIHNVNRQRDFELVQDFVNSKRTIPLYDKRKELKISGDIRGEIYWRTETGVVPGSSNINFETNRLRGNNFASGGQRIPIWTYAGIVNLQLDYRMEKAWAQAKVKFEDSWGVEENNLGCFRDNRGLFGSGTFDLLCLKSAFFGYNLYKCDNHSFDVEVGRRGQLYKVFDSLIEFNSVLDGFFFRYRIKKKPDWLLYAQAAIFVVDEKVNHYAEAIEIGTLDFNETGWDVKYSLINWKKHGRNRCDTREFLGSKFLVSQIALAYNFKKDQSPFKRKARIYGAFLDNYLAPHVQSLHNSAVSRRLNLGWYLGFIIGEVKEKGDWSLDVNYQYAQAFVCPDADVHGIGRGNVLRELNTFAQRGKTNYKGWHFEGLYAVTKDLQLDFTYEFSSALNRTFGGPHNYHKAELDIILAF